MEKGANPFGLYLFWQNLKLTDQRNMVKQKVTIVKDLNIVLSDLEPWVKTPQFLYKGRPGNIQLSPREILANWLLCAVGNSVSGNNSLTFCNDPFGGGDGIIIDRKNGNQMVTEHVFIPKFKTTPGKTIEELIVESVNKKQKKGGEAYAAGKHLIIFFDVIGKWAPNRVGRKIQGTHNFLSVWAISLERVGGGDTYFYYVARFNEVHTPVYQVKIDFKGKKWSIQNVQ